jgi:hypothetical protein
MQDRLTTLGDAKEGLDAGERLLAEGGFGEHDWFVGEAVGWARDYRGEDMIWE